MEKKRTQLVEAVPSVQVERGGDSGASVLATLVNCLTLAKIQGDESTAAAVREELRPLLRRLCTSSTKLCVRIKSANKCCGCQRVKETKRLPECCHDICRECLTIEVERVSCNSYDKRVYRSQCPKCAQKIAREGILLFFTEAEIAERHAKTKESQKRVMLTCPVCTLEYDVDEAGISLECDHMFCKSCITAHVENLIKENKVSEAELVCPQCQVPIGDQILAYLSKDAQCLDKLVGFRLREMRGVDEYYKNCPACDFGGFIPINERVFHCEKCNKYMCPNCNVSPPHSGEERCKEDTGLLGVEGIRFCPKCKAPIERKSGCNFMTCASAACKSKTHFCYLCGFELQLNQHYSHFKKKGPWGVFCNNTEGDYLARHPDQK